MSSLCFTLQGWVRTAGDPCCPKSSGKDNMPQSCYYRKKMLTFLTFPPHQTSCPNPLPVPVGGPPGDPSGMLIPPPIPSAAAVSQHPGMSLPRASAAPVSSACLAPWQPPSFSPAIMYSAAPSRPSRDPALHVTQSLGRPHSASRKPAPSGQCGLSTWEICLVDGEDGDDGDGDTDSPLVGAGMAR